MILMRLPWSRYQFKVYRQEKFITKPINEWKNYCFKYRYFNLQ